MKRDNCPICKSKKIKFFGVLDIKKDIENIIKNNSNIPDEMMELYNNFDSNISNALEYEKLRGRECLCLNCGFSFLEELDYSKYDQDAPKKVSFEEFSNYIMDNISDKEAGRQILKEYQNKDAFYLEVADQIVETIQKFINRKEVNIFEEDNSEYVN